MLVYMNVASVMISTGKLKHIAVKFSPHDRLTIIMARGLLPVIRASYGPGSSYTSTSPMPVVPFTPESWAV